MEKTDIFQVGDKVYDIRFGWGEVIKVREKPDKTVVVKFPVSSAAVWYTCDGKLNSIFNATLSFTDYSGTKPLSQERPVWIPEKGEWVLVKSTESSPWVLRRFSYYNQEIQQYACFIEQESSGMIYHWKYCISYSDFVAENS